MSMKIKNKKKMTFIWCMVILLVIIIGIYFYWNVIATDRLKVKNLQTNPMIFLSKKGDEAGEIHYYSLLTEDGRYCEYTDNGKQGQYTILKEDELSENEVENMKFLIHNLSIALPEEIVNPSEIREFRTIFLENDTKVVYESEYQDVIKNMFEGE